MNNGPFYYLHNKSDEVYIHYNPHKAIYFCGDKLTGAVLFRKEGGENFMSLSGLDTSWSLIEADSIKDLIKGKRSDEKAAFDITH